MPGQHEEAALAEELVLAARHDLGAALAAFVGLVVVFVVLETGGRRALAQHHVERFLDVVGVQLFVEVDHIVVVLFGLFDHHGFGAVVAKPSGLSCELVRMQTIKKKTTKKLLSADWTYHITSGQPSIKGQHGPAA